jgi:hypothetical protein
MKRAAVVIALALAVALPLRADFDSIVDALESRGGLHRVHIPFLGLARLAIWVARPKGVYDFQLATWEGSGRMDRREMAAIVRREIGNGFSPIVQATSERSGEWTFIYGRPRGRNIELMVVTHDPNDTVVVRAVVDAETFTENFDSPTGLTRIARR